MAAKKLHALINELDYDIESLAKKYNPYKSRRQVYHNEDDCEDDSGDSKNDDDDELGTQTESSSFIFASDNNMIQPQSPFMAQIESSFMAASNDMVQSQSTVIPFNKNIVQPEPSFMPLSNSSTNMVQQSESARIKQLEELNRIYKSTIKRINYTYIFVLVVILFINWRGATRC